MHCVETVSVDIVSVAENRERSAAFAAHPAEIFGDFDIAGGRECSCETGINNCLVKTGLSADCFVNIEHACGCCLRESINRVARKGFQGAERRRNAVFKECNRACGAVFYDVYRVYCEFAGGCGGCNAVACA